MKQNKKRSSAKYVWILSGAIALVLVTGGVLVAKLLISDDEGKRRQVVQMVTLIKPPPPPPIKEKPPEPEVKKEEIVEQKKDEAKQEESKEADDKPAGNQLGLDADGTAGSDGFGLVGVKGGRALIGDSGGDFLKKYGWYTGLIQEELKKRVKQHLDQNGGIPKGKLEALVRIVLDDNGTIVGFDLVGSSGNPGMDQAVRLALAGAKVNESPPEGMPRTVKLKVSSQG